MLDRRSNIAENTRQLSPLYLHDVTRVNTDKFRDFQIRFRISFVMLLQHILFNELSFCSLIFDFQPIILCFRPPVQEVPPQFPALKMNPPKASHRTSIAQRSNHLINNCISLLTHLCRAGILERVLHKNAFSLRHAEGIGLRLRGISKLCRSDCYSRHSLNFEPYRVMQTARRTGSSVSQCYNNKIVGRVDFHTQLIRRWFGKGRLHIARNFDLWQALFKALLQPIK